MVDIKIIEDIFVEYKNITESIIEEIEKEAEVEKLFIKREELLSKLSEIDEKSIIQEMYKNLAIDADNRLRSVILEEQKNVKIELQKIHRKKNANNTYNNNANRISLLNRTI